MGTSPCPLCRGVAGTETHHTARDHDERELPEKECGNQNPLLSMSPALPTASPHGRGHARKASPALPPAKPLQPWSPRGRNPSLPHSEQRPPNTDEAEPLSKQLLSDSARPKRAPGVTEFSHLPREISKCAVLPREEVPPASSTAPSGHSGTTPGKTFWAVAPRTSSSQVASEPPARPALGALPTRGGRGEPGALPRLSRGFKRRSV